MNPTPEKPYGLTLDRREKAVLTGVTDVERFDENEVVLHTHGGRLIVTGTGLCLRSAASSRTIGATTAAR